jgi:eukaryotic-like serine/threonine-protein kinase
VSRVSTDVVLGDRYRLVRRVASGGMGSVWEAEDSVLHRRVAVKVLADVLAADHRFVERFRREARAAAGLSHPNVAGVFDYGEDDGTQFMVMELIDGETLAQRLQRVGHLPPEEATRVAADVGDALESAHRAGLVHRDVKPANIMLTHRGDVKVMDFGIAAAAWATPLTASGATLGTAVYISPEQASGKRATPVSDVYSLGVVLYEMLAGRPPFRADNAVALATAHVRDQPPPLREVAPWVPSQLALACEKALTKEPAARPTSAAAFAAMLRGGGGPDPDRVNPTLVPEEGGPTRELVADRTEILHGEPAAAPPAADPGPRRRPRSPRRTAWALLAALLLVAVLGTLIAIGLAGDTAPEGGTKGGSKPASTVTIPHLQGLSQSQAEQVLDANGLTLGDVRKAPGRRGEVVRTDPVEGTPVAPGSTVTLYVGAGQKNHEDHGKGNDEGKGKEH